jgi:hypothetical protein
LTRSPARPRDWWEGVPRDAWKSACEHHVQQIAQRTPAKIAHALIVYEQARLHRLRLEQITPGLLSRRKAS